MRRMTTGKVGKLGGRDYPVIHDDETGGRSRQMDTHRDHRRQIRHHHSRLHVHPFQSSEPAGLSHDRRAGLAEHLAATAQNGAEPDLDRARRRDHHLHPVDAVRRLRHDEGKCAAYDRWLRADPAARLCRRSRSAQDHRRSGRGDGATGQDPRGDGNRAARDELCHPLQRAAQLWRRSVRHRSGPREPTSPILRPRSPRATTSNRARRASRDRRGARAQSQALHRFKGDDAGRARATAPSPPMC